MAAFIEWKPQYSLGIAEVDHEHREMIELINDLYEALQSGSDNEEIEAFLADVYGNIAAHFALEERLMQQMRYPEFAPHKADHERLLDEIADIMDSAHENDRFDPEQLSHRLERWFTGHFSTFDSRLHEAGG